MLAAVALPANIVQLTKDRGNDTLHHDPAVSGTEFAMIELARDRVDPEYVVTADPRVAEVDGGLFIGIPAAAYLDAAAHNGSIGRSLAEVRGSDEPAPDRRRLADRRARTSLRGDPRPARRIALPRLRAPARRPLDLLPAAPGAHRLRARGRAAGRDRPAPLRRRAER